MVASSIGDYVDSVTADVLRQAAANYSGTEGSWGAVYDAAMGFVAAVDWSEWWIVALLTTELLLAACVFTLRKHIDLQICFFGVMCGIVLCAQPINALGSQHWRSFSTQDYFDKNGFFVSFTISLPLLCIAVFQLAHALCSSKPRWS